MDDRQHKKVFKRNCLSADNFVYKNGQRKIYNKVLKKPEECIK